MRSLSQGSDEHFSKTMALSPSQISSQGWFTSQSLREGGLTVRPEDVSQMDVSRLATPNSWSRRDILFDSQGPHKTPIERGECPEGSVRSQTEARRTPTQPIPPAKIEGFELFRTVWTRLIPQDATLDRYLEETCHFFASRSNSLDLQTDATQKHSAKSSNLRNVLIVHTPHITLPEELPLDYPRLRSYAYLYEFQPSSPDSHMHSGTGDLSIHFHPFSSAIPSQLERTLQALFHNTIRLLGTEIPLASEGDACVENHSEDDIIPGHQVQHTYDRLKSLYADDLRERWVEKTESSKHIFDDFMVAAFLIELWRGMYGVTPANEDNCQNQANAPLFPGFVDVACGNGVLVYILLMEGYPGCGFDARQRQTWVIFPDWVQAKLMEKVYIPKPFAHFIQDEDVNMSTFAGEFPGDTFIISNHADELTVWTPLMAALACPSSPLPFLAIPCCSHSLSGASYRYPPPTKSRRKANVTEQEHHGAKLDQTFDPMSGDLKALRAVKDHEKTQEGRLNSMYGSLAAKTLAIAAEVGYDVEKTPLQLRSTRNLAVVGGRLSATNQWKRNPAVQSVTSGKANDGDSNIQVLSQKIVNIVDRECIREGGRQASARTWVERIQNLHLVHGNRRYPDDT